MKEEIKDAWTLHLDLGDDGDDLPNNVEKESDSYNCEPDNLFVYCPPGSPKTYSVGSGFCACAYDWENNKIEFPICKNCGQKMTIETHLSGERLFHSCAHCYEKEIRSKILSQKKVKPKS